jgi:hypothetical protein
MGKMMRMLQTGHHRLSSHPHSAAGSLPKCALMSSMHTRQDEPADK